jgi:putative endonuclease
MSSGALWFLYIVQSDVTGHLYTGISPDPDRRVRQHNGLIKGGSKATRGGRPWRLVFIEECPSKSCALRREHAIKQLTRAAKLTLVERHRQIEDTGALTPPVEDR